MVELALPVRRAALLLVELQNDIVRESSIGPPGCCRVPAAATAAVP